MSEPLLSAWHSANPGLGLRALLHLVARPEHATSARQMARAINANPSQVEQCLGELVGCGLAFAEPAEGGTILYRLAASPSAHLLAGHVARNAKTFDDIGQALVRVLTAAAMGDRRPPTAVSATTPS